jgi:hypothetical protein
MEPPTATMAICPAESWWRRPSSLVRPRLVRPRWIAGEAGSEGMQHHIKNYGIAQVRRAVVGRVGGEIRSERRFRIWAVSETAMLLQQRQISGSRAIRCDNGSMRERSIAVRISGVDAWWVD